MSTDPFFTSSPCRNCAKVSLHGLFPIRRRDKDNDVFQYLSVEDVDNPQQVRSRPRFIVAESLDKLIQSARSGCPLCRHVCCAFDLAYSAGKMPMSIESLLLSGQGGDSEIRITSDDVRGLFQTYIVRGVERVRFYPELIIEPFGFRLETNQESLKWAQEANRVDVTPCAHPLGHQAIKQIEGWTLKCFSDHKACRNPESDFWADGLSFVRFLDVGTDPEPSTVKLTRAFDVTNSGQTRNTPKYTALSYMWGGITRHVTTWGNIERRTSQGFSVANLPQTLRDAIVITRKLCIRYIWIDSLCILQRGNSDSDLEGHARKDFARHVKIMHRIYAHALYTLAASNSEDTDTGMLRDRAFATWNAPYVAIPLGNIARFSTAKALLAHIPGLRRSQAAQDLADDKFGLYQYSDSPKWDTTVEGAVIETRGWCFQERVLSTRRLCFTREAIFWECRELQASEIRPSGYSTLAEYKDNRPRSIEYYASLMRTIHRDAPDKQLSLKAWQELVIRSTQRDLSLDGDRLNAFAGISQEWRKVSGRKDRYLAGIWEDDLALQAAGLGWSADLAICGGRVEAIPSWSWGSLFGTSVVFPHVRAYYGRVRFVWGSHLVLEGHNVDGAYDESASARDGNGSSETKTGSNDGKSDALRDASLPAGALRLRSDFARIPWSAIRHAMRSGKERNNWRYLTVPDLLPRQIWHPDTYDDLDCGSARDGDDDKALCMHLYNFMHAGPIEAGWPIFLILAPVGTSTGTGTSTSVSTSSDTKADDADPDNDANTADDANTATATPELWRRVGTFETRDVQDFADFEKGRQIILV